MGVKVTVSAVVPTGGTVAGAVQAKAPDTEAVPPVRVDEARVCPLAIVLAVGHVDTAGVAWVTVTAGDVPVAEL